MSLGIIILLYLGQNCTCEVGTYVRINKERWIGMYVYTYIRGTYIQRNMDSHITVYIILYERYICMYLCT